MIEFQSITLKNFLSVGNNTQAVDLDRKELVLIIGENRDVGGDDTSCKNGVGKTCILNALSYALFGQSISNIRKDLLINRSNGKNMIVTVNFTVNGQAYRIERGRKPGILKFYIDGIEQESKDEAQGDSRETQQKIDEILHMSHDLFQQMVALNTYSRPFLTMNANEQRTIIEQLLGITLLSEKSDRLREQMKITREMIVTEDIRLKAVQEANSRIQKQIDNLITRQKAWTTQKRNSISELTDAIDELSKLDLDQEILSHQQATTYDAQLQKQTHTKQLLKNAEISYEKEKKLAVKVDAELATLKEHRCYACGQTVHDHAPQLAAKTKQREEITTALLKYQTQVVEFTNQLTDIGSLIKPKKTFYQKIEQAVEHRSNLENLQKSLELKQSEVNPYTDQITEMTAQALQTIDFSQMNMLKRVQEHEEFLLKLLTNKDSFIRKKIINQNLAFLNSRLRFYLFKMGLPHSVIFENDLSVSISELGRDLDFGNLSKGEGTRLNLSLSWSYRDVWESLYTPINFMFVDEFLDSGLDQAGVENAMTILKHMARDRHRSIFLISHRDELISRAASTITVVKEGGFTQIIA